MMKKAISLCLCFGMVFCLLLCGCETNARQNFEGASAFLDAIEGEWIVWQDIGNRKSGVSTICLSKDYSVTMNDESGTWKFEKEPPKSINSFTIDISLKNGTIWRAHLARTAYDTDTVTEEKTYSKYTLKIGLPKDAFTSETYINKNDYEIVDITLQNYADYFEFKEFYEAEKDNFGEFRGEVALNYALVPRAGLQIDGDRSKVKIKASYSISVYEIAYDSINDTCNTLGAVKKYDTVYSREVDFFKDAVEDDGPFAASIYGTNLIDDRYTQNHGDGQYTLEIDHPENVKILAAQGKLYLNKK